MMQCSNIRSLLALLALLAVPSAVHGGGIGGYSNWTNATDWSWCVTARLRLFVQSPDKAGAAGRPPTALRPLTPHALQPHALRSLTHTRAAPHSDPPTYLGGSGTCQGSSTLCALATNACKVQTCIPGVTAGVSGCTNDTAPTTFTAALGKIGGNKTCTQSTDLRCSSSSLTTMFSPFGSVVAAYCNDAYLVVLHYNSPSTFSTMLGGHNLDMMNGVIFPPQGGTGNICNTRQGSFKCSAISVSKFPLNFTLLPTDSNLNNANQNVFGPGSSAGNQSGGWIVLNARSTDTVQVGLPTRGAVGVAMNGQVRVCPDGISLRLRVLMPALPSPCVGNLPVLQ